MAQSATLSLPQINFLPTALSTPLGPALPSRALRVPWRVRETWSEKYVHRQGRSRRTRKTKPRALIHCQHEPRVHPLEQLEGLSPSPSHYTMTHVCLQLVKGEFQLHRHITSHTRTETIAQWEEENRGRKIYWSWPCLTLVCGQHC